MSVRRGAIMALGAMLLAGGAAACGSDEGGSAGGGSSGDKEPLRVAIFPSSGGPFGIYGKANRDAWQFAADEINAQGGVDGHKLELVVSQTDNQPATTMRAVRKTITQDKVGFIGGVISSAEAGALQQQLVGLNAVFINGNARDDVLTGESCSPNAFRTVQSQKMDITALTETLAKLPAKTWAIQAVDYTTGHNAAEGFKKAAEAAGKTVVAEQYAPLGTTEFGSYISKLKSAKADGLFAAEYGADGVAFVNQGEQFKLFDDYETVLGWNLVSDPQFEAFGDKVVGFYNNLGYDANLDTPQNREFVDAWKSKFGRVPFFMEADNYVAAQMLFEAVRKAGSIEPAKVKEALKVISFDSLYGPVKMAEDGQLLRPSYIGQVVKDEDGLGGLGWKVVAKAPGEVTHREPDPACKKA